MPGPNVPPTAPNALSETVTIDKPVLQEILDYLSLRPYGEVHQLIANLAQSIQRQAMMKQMREKMQANGIQPGEPNVVEKNEEPAKKTSTRGRRLSKTS